MKDYVDKKILQNNFLHGYWFRLHKKAQYRFDTCNLALE